MPQISVLLTMMKMLSVDVSHLTTTTTTITTTTITATKTSTTITTSTTTVTSELGPIKTINFDKIEAKKTKRLLLL